MNETSLIDIYTKTKQSALDASLAEASSSPWGGHLFQKNPSKLDIALKSVSGRTAYSETAYNDLLQRYVTQISIVEQFEKTIIETDQQVSSLLTRITMAFVVIIVLTAWIFGAFLK